MIRIERSSARGPPASRRWSCRVTGSLMASTLSRVGRRQRGAPGEPGRNPMTRGAHRKGGEGEDKIAMGFALGLNLALPVGPRVWRLRADRRHGRAEALLARVRSAVNRRFRGESMLSIEVHPPTLRRPGRVVLS